MTEPSKPANDKIEANAVTFQRAGWISAARWLVFICLIGLNIALPCDLVSRLMHHNPVHWGFELVQALFVVACDMYLLPVCLLEPSALAVGENGVVVRALVWRSRIPYKDVVSFNTPRGLTWGLLRTSRCFYLINRGDIKNFDELASLIGQKLNSRST